MMMQLVLFFVCVAIAEVLIFLPFILRGRKQQQPATQSVKCHPEYLATPRDVATLLWASGLWDKLIADLYRQAQSCRRDGESMADMPKLDVTVSVTVERARDDDRG